MIPLSNPASDQRKITNPDGLYNPVSSAYSFAVSAPGALVFLAGHWAGDIDGNLIEGDFAAQVDRTLENMAITLAAEGLGFEHVLKLTAFVVDHDAETLNAVVAAESRIWGDRPPAHSLIPVPALAGPGLRFELEAVAARPVITEQNG
ncbi:RidA family protein [Mycetocola tolaasinivorans]|uniref:RidA family protein n=1 Tax=Mycetocola tolaasinivorans TaxID=76635 RepID=A0A3L7A2S4_9MICO|nr:RidA family protein [Mycetocola tolaasinivorans]RLP74320.1 RidA family protein [Mycetocola tolaasinivorans]